jgi:T-complex protein 1 subunit alpha
VRRVKPEDIKRIAKATGGQVVVTMADMEGDEAFDANALGEVRHCNPVTTGHVTAADALFSPGSPSRPMLQFTPAHHNHTAAILQCAEVSEERVGDGELLYFRGCKNGRACTVVLRGANEFMLDEMDRSLHDTLCVIKVSVTCCLLCCDVTAFTFM